MTPEQIASTWASLRTASEAWAAALVIQKNPSQQVLSLEAVVRQMARIREGLPQNFLLLPTLPADVLALVLASKGLSEAVQDHLVLLGDSLKDGAPDASAERPS